MNKWIHTQKIKVYIKISQITPEYNHLLIIPIKTFQGLLLITILAVHMLGEYQLSKYKQYLFISVFES